MIKIQVGIMSREENPNTSTLNKDLEQSSLLIPTTLLESVVDILDKNLHFDPISTKLTNESEVLVIIEKIEGNLSKIKGRFGEKNVSSTISRRDNRHHNLFPPPPFMVGKTDLYKTADPNNIAEEASSTSTISSNGDVDSKLNTEQRTILFRDDETLTQSKTQIGPLHQDRRQSRRLSHPYLSHDDDSVSNC